MKIELEVWQMITLLLAFFGGCAGVGKVLLAQSQKHLDDKFKAQEKVQTGNHAQLSTRLDSIESANRSEANQWQRVERELLTLKADMPLQYVRREDYIRGQSIIESKLDGLAMKLENAQLRGVMMNQTSHGGSHAN